MASPLVTTASSLDIEQAISTGETARRLSCSHTWVKHLIATGDLAAVRSTLGWLVDPASVTAYLERRQEAEVDDESA